MRRLVRELRVPLLLGSDEIEPGDPPKNYNSAFMLDPAGATAAVYRKIHLVPFGEYVPFQRLLFFVGPLVEAVSAFSPGTRVTMLPVEGHMVSTAICYEVTYPALQREAVRQGSEMLTTITNDAWYGESSAAFQHFEMAAMRAIEQGRYLVRSANTGISGIIDPYGRVLIRTSLFETVGRRRRGPLRAGEDGVCHNWRSGRARCRPRSWWSRSHCAFVEGRKTTCRWMISFRRSEGLVEARLRDAELSLTVPTTPAS